MGQDGFPNMADLPKRIAIVYDRVNKWGGAEQVLLTLHELFPQAPLYTAVYDSAKAPWAKVFPQIIPSFLQKFPLAKSHHELYPWLTPLAFESLNFDNYDIVISVTSADAKGIITKPGTFHLCYCLTPTRYLWSHENSYQQQLGIYAKPVFNYLKSWDKTVSRRPDFYISISQIVQSRVQKYYDISSPVIYPPVDFSDFTSQTPANDFFLYVGRLIAYKQAQVLVEIFNDLKLPLVIIGTGYLLSKLQRLAQDNVKILGFLPRNELISYYQRAKAFVSLHEEDFGLVYVEAQAAGKPVLALNTGGVKEIVIHNQTGLLHNSISDLKETLVNFYQFLFDPQIIKDNALRFSKERFKQEFAKVLESQWKKYKTTYML